MFRRFGATVSTLRVTDLFQMDAEVVRRKGQVKVSDRLVGHMYEGRNRRQRCSEPMEAIISKDGPFTGFTLKMEAMWPKRHNI
jgi:hypothetical protein